MTFHAGRMEPGNLQWWISHCRTGGVGKWPFHWPGRNLSRFKESKKCWLSRGNVHVMLEPHVELPITRNMELKWMADI